MANGSRGVLAGRVALVTGASRGIGRAIVLAFAQSGASVAGLARDPERLSAVAAEAERCGAATLGLLCDVTQADQVEAAVAATLERFGRLDILVNNAGASPYDKPVVEYGQAEWAAVLAVNLTAPFLVCRAAAPALLRRPGSSVINVVSVAADTPIPGESAYSAAKAGLVSLTRSLAQEWSPRGVRVNALAPGYIRTEINRAIWGPLEPYLDERGAAHVPPTAAAADPQLARALAVYERTVRRTPLGRYGTPEEVAGLAVYLASDTAGFVSGATFFADGGWQARR